MDKKPIEPFVVPLANTEQRIAQAIEPIMHKEGFELVALRLVNKGARPILCIYADAIDASGISMAQLEILNRLIGNFLDVMDAEEGLFPASYDLEVSSPGLDRPLSKKSHFIQGMGQIVRLKTDGRQGLPKAMTGKLKLADETGLQLQWPLEDENALLEVPYDTLQQAHIVFQFGNKPPNPPQKRVTGEK